MKVLIFGATGPAGQWLVRKALEAGHEVTAYVRSPGKLEPTQPRLLVIVGELTDAAAIQRAVEGQDAVISLLGPGGSSTGTPVADGMQRIVQAMQRAGVRRLIATATTSAPDAQDRFSLPFWLAMQMVKVLAGSAYDEILATAAAVRNSTLDWTLVRLPMLSDKPCNRPAVAAHVGHPAIKLFALSRERLAEFLVAQLSETRWMRQSPALSNGA
jgi:nucleoside-diphosphate-sugar epimerase